MKPLLLTLLTCAFSISVISAETKDDKIEVRPLDKNKIEAYHLGMNSGVTIMENAADVEKLIKDPKLLSKHPEAAKLLAEQVDFSKEKIVLVRWNDGGPPFGSLKHEVKKKGKDITIEFCVQLPDVEVRYLSLGTFADFFAVPKDIPVSLGVARK